MTLKCKTCARFRQHKCGDNCLYFNVNISQLVEHGIIFNADNCVMYLDQNTKGLK